ncbi:olfactory receptor 10S1, partial [Echinops telfairi]|uniref:Olfactory receptor 10S1 n=1 Tax=Echinops telfairi TaxID=9371 RepID=A0ABM1VLC4_ECHTE
LLILNFSIVSSHYVINLISVVGWTMNFRGKRKFRKICGYVIVETAITWAIGAVHSAIHTSLTFHLLYCGPHHISYFFCDIPPVLKLACADTTINEIVMLANIGIVAAGCLILIITSYVFIVGAVLRIRTAEGRQRAFSTCTAHLTVVLLYYMPPVCIYLQPHSGGAGSGVPAVFYTVVTPMLNPFIYTLRNKEVKQALGRLLCQGPQESPESSLNP